MARLALGLIETKGLTGAIRATHAATRAGEIAIASAERCESGGITVKIEGEWDTVQAAVEAGARAADEAGELVSMHVIPRPDSAVSSILPYQRFLDRFRPTDSEQDKSKKTKAVPPPRAKTKKPESDRRPATPQVVVPPTPADPSPPIVPAPQPTEIRPVRSEPTLIPIQAPVAAGSTDSSGHEISWQQLEGMAVVKMRKYARALTGLSIQGREISKANKQQLLDAIKELRQSQPE